MIFFGSFLSYLLVFAVFVVAVVVAVIIGVSIGKSGAEKKEKEVAVEDEYSDGNGNDEIQIG